VKRRGPGPAYTLAVLFAINAINFFDRSIMGALAEPLRREWGLSDSALGGLGTAFILLYAVVGVPLGRLTDRTRRTPLLAAGVFAWSLLTAASGLTRSFWQLFVARLGVGVGEATCAPAATSLIGDLFPAQQRSKALSIFMLGLPIGIALSFAVSSLIAKSYGWRAAFYVAGVPGLLCALAALSIPEPPRGAAEAHAVGIRRRAGSPYLRVLAIPTMRWLILSGALHTFNMYALGGFLSPLLIRFHGVDLRAAGLISMGVYGLSGIPGLLLGGIAGDAIMKRRANGRLLLGAWLLFASVPLAFLALASPPGDITAFIPLMGLACALMYAYYSTVYATIHDVIEPSLRGTAMALYFCAMYALGASLGPYGTGVASDAFARHAALAAGVTELTLPALEPFRGQGLRAALYLIPALGSLLTLALFAGSRTVTKDRQELQRWMAESPGESG
jgi:predicted MFS family arabinose efflux permease